MRRAALLTVLAGITASASACDDYGVFGPRRDFEGHYSYAGTVDDAFGDAVVGTITITRQRADRAEVFIDWSYLDRGIEIVRITTDFPAQAILRSDGWIEFEFHGDLFLDGRVTEFSLFHGGWWQRGRIDGEWELHTGLPTNDFGSFVARRD